MFLVVTIDEFGIIGSGNGFWRGYQKNPDHNWLGIEILIQTSHHGGEKTEEAGVQNARILRYDNWCLDDLFEEGSLAARYCNHPDPWTKRRYTVKTNFGETFCQLAGVGDGGCRVAHQNRF